MKTARVLLVDDNPDHLERLAVLLSEHYAVSSLGSTAEALRELDPSRRMCWSSAPGRSSITAGWSPCRSRPR